MPVFEQTTKTLYERNHVDEDELVGSDYHTGDLSDVANQFVWGDLSVSELTAMSPSPQDLANSIWGAVEAFAAVDPVGDRAGSR